jgi:hypothetical protein
MKAPGFQSRIRFTQTLFLYQFRGLWYTNPSYWFHGRRITPKSLAHYRVRRGGMKHQTCFKHVLKWRRLRALGGKNELGFDIVEMSCECPARLISLQQRHLISRFQERQCSKVQKRVSLLCSFSMFLFIVNNGVSISEHYCLFPLPHRLNPSKTSDNCNYQRLFNI